MEPGTSVMIVAGEVSGDRHAAGLVRALQHRFGEGTLQFYGSGGPALGAAGVELLHDISRLAAIGPSAAIRHLGEYLRLLRQLNIQAVARKTALAILVDFPDFNLPLAKRLRKKGIPVCYFISPQIWAWRKGRVKQIRRDVDLMLVIFPFEEAIYKDHGVPATYVGNPTAERFRTASWKVPNEVVLEPLVALLPGSRMKEVELILPIQLEAARALSRTLNARFRLLRAPGIDEERLQAIIGREFRSGGPPIELVSGAAEAVLGSADCALVKSGTATLETMLAGVPFAMVYRLPLFSWLLLRPLVRNQTFCLANLVAGRPVVPEFVQWQAKGEVMARYLESILTTPGRLARIQDEFRAVVEELGCVDAYSEAAREIADRFLQ